MKHIVKHQLPLPAILSVLIALLVSLQVSIARADDANLPKELSPEAAEAVKKAIAEAEARAKGVDVDKARKQAEKEAKAKAEKAAKEKAKAEKAAKRAKAKAEKEAKAKAEKEAKAKAKLKKEEAEKLSKSKEDAKAKAPAKAKADKKAATAKSGAKSTKAVPSFDRKKPDTHSSRGGQSLTGRTTAGVLLGDLVKASADMLIPMLHTDKGGMLFLDPRYTADDEEEQQFAVGLGWRQNLADRDVIVGGNVFYDSIWTEGDAQFNQIGFGLEVLSELLDARFNYYLPEDDLDGDAPSAPRAVSAPAPRAAASSGDRVFPGGARLAGATVFPGGATLGSSPARSSTGAGLEPSFEGFDAEIGIKLPVDQIPETRVFAGLQIFDNALGGDDFEGFVGRVEMRPNPGVTLDLQYFTEDDLNKDASWFAGVRFNLPFSLAELAHGRNPFAGSTSVFQSANGSFDSRMYEYLIRNPQ